MLGCERDLWIMISRSTFSSMAWPRRSIFTATSSIVSLPTSAKVSLLVGCRGNGSQGATGAAHGARHLHQRTVFLRSEPVPHELGHAEVAKAQLLYRLVLIQPLEAVHCETPPTVGVAIAALALMAVSCCRPAPLPHRTLRDPASRLTIGSALSHINPWTLVRVPDLHVGLLRGGEAYLLGDTLATGTRELGPHLGEQCGVALVRLRTKVAQLPRCGRLHDGVAQEETGALTLPRLMWRRPISQRGLHLSATRPTARRGEAAWERGSAVGGGRARCSTPSKTRSALSYGGRMRLPRKRQARC
eukprot:scaffold4547_cov335-Prasinococcus_capsulatus_cf.AAC.7